MRAKGSNAHEEGADEAAAVVDVNAGSAESKNKKDEISPVKVPEKVSLISMLENIEIEP